MEGITLPPNFEWGFAGDVEMMQESAAAMGLALLLATAFIYIVLASQFESFTQPFAIMLSLPLSLIGVVLTLTSFILKAAAMAQRSKREAEDALGRGAPYWAIVWPSGEVRWTKRVARPASAAVVVKISRMARATCGMVVIGKLLVGRHYGVCRNPIMP